MELVIRRGIRETVRTRFVAVALVMVLTFSTVAALVEREPAVADEVATESLLPCWAGTTTWGTAFVIMTLFPPQNQLVALVGWAALALDGVDNAVSCATQAPKPVKYCLTGAYKGTYGGVKYYRVEAANCLYGQYVL